MEQQKGQQKTQNNRVLSRKRRRRRRSVSVALLTFLLAGVVWLIVVFLFRIDEIKVENSITSVYTGNQIIAASGLEKGKNILSFKKSDISKRLIGQLPYLGRVDIERKLPGKVILKVSETTDYMGIPYRGGYLIVSNDMKILADVYNAPAEVPMVYGLTPTSFIPGNPLTAEDPGSLEGLRAVLEQIDAYKWFDKISVINVRDKLDVSIVYDDRIFVRIGSIAKIDYKFELFNETLRNQLNDDYTGNINLSTIKYVYATEGDMRFPAGFFDIGNAGS